MKSQKHGGVWHDCVEGWNQRLRVGAVDQTEATVAEVIWVQIREGLPCHVKELHCILLRNKEPAGNLEEGNDGT